MDRELLKYLDAMDGSWGCRSRYESKIANGFSTEKSMAYLAGWYSALLDATIESIGKQKLRDLIEARLNLGD